MTALDALHSRQVYDVCALSVQGGNSTPEVPRACDADQTFLYKPRSENAKHSTIQPASKMDIFELSEIVAGGDEAVTTEMQRNGLLRTDVHCQPCGRQLTQIRKKGSTTGFVFRCPGCRRKEALTTGSFFAGSHLAMKKHLALLYFWSCETSVAEATGHVGVSSATVVQWYLYFRDICSWKLLQAPIVLGGVGTVVQIDESVMVRSKYHRGRHRRQRWVFGVYDPQQRQGYIQLVPRRDATTLLPIIQRVVAPGTTVWSDEWRAYAGLAGLGDVHRR